MTSHKIIESYKNKNYLEPHRVPKKIKSDIPESLTSKLAKLIGFAGFLVITLSYAPSIYYYAKSSGGKLVAQYLYATGTESAPQDLPENRDSGFLPPVNYELPFIPMLIIDSIKVETQIHEASLNDYEEALKKGVWRVTDWGTPLSREKPTILAAHRYGYLKWSTGFRRKHSFLNLTKLKEGDLMKIYWQRREFTYAVYATSEGEKISDYTANLILYTCRDLVSNVRIFVYARLLEI